MEEPDEEPESEGGELVGAAQKVPAKPEAKEPTERTDDPVRIYLREMGSKNKSISLAAKPRACDAEICSYSR